MGDNVVTFENGLARLLPIDESKFEDLGVSPLGFDDEYTEFMEMWDEEFMVRLNERREAYEHLHPSPEWDAMDKIAYDEVILQMDKLHGTNVSGKMIEQKIGRVMTNGESRDNVIHVDFTKKKGK
jgi:hypothetical protein